MVVLQGDAGTNPDTETDQHCYYFQDGDTSTSWQINNVIIKIEVRTLNNTVDNNITKHLLEGQSLNLSSLNTTP